MAAHTASAIVEQVHDAGLNLSLAPTGGLAVALSSPLTADLHDLIRNSKALLIQDGHARFSSGFNCYVYDSYLRTLYEG